MNQSRFVLGLLVVIPTLLFIAAAESAPDPASSNAPPNAQPAPKVPAPKKPAPAAAQPNSPPLRTEMQRSALPGSQRADTAASDAIVSAIRADPGMAGADVSVNTENGVASLTGIVRNREQSAIASAYASRQPDVMRVDNALTIPAQ